MRTWGSEIRGLTFDKLQQRNGRVYAYTGYAPLFEPLIKWHQDGADPGKLPEGVDHKADGGWTLIVVDHSGLSKYTSSIPYIERFDPPIAFGAGADLAMGAMLAGADAKRAVELVAGLCNHTGGRIQVVERPKPLAVAAE